MKKIAATIAVITALFAAGMMPAALAYADKTDADTVSVVFTHDMHSHLDEFGRLKTAMDAVKERYPQTLALDAGDFSMGTPYQVIYSEYAPELKMMDYLGFDATTFGNHEFDYRAAGLADMLNAAGDLDIRMVTANIDWDQTLADEELREDAGRLKRPAMHTEQQTIR